MEVADDRLRAEDRLTLELHHDPQYAVGGGVLRPHVDDHRLVIAELDVDVAGIEDEALGQAQEGALLDGKLICVREIAVEHLLRAFGGLRREALLELFTQNGSGSRSGPARDAREVGLGGVGGLGGHAGCVFAHRGPGASLN